MAREQGFHNKGRTQSAAERVFMYVRLAKREEQDARAEFGDAYTRREANTPAFFPRLGVKKAHV